MSERQRANHRALSDQRPGSIKGIHTIGVPVTDQDRAVRFYVEVLGFDVTVRGPDVLFLSAGGYHHDLGFNTWESRDASPPPPGTTGLYHVAIRYPTRAALGDALRRLVEARWPIDGASDHGTHEALYLRDPDGNGLELAWDRPEQEWPLDANGHLTWARGRIDLDDLRRAGAQGEAVTGSRVEGPG
jgi:catechol 2,3-dioxygenase